MHGLHAKSALSWCLLGRDEERIKSHYSIDVTGLATQILALSLLACAIWGIIGRAFTSRAPFS
jgi:hypothetical protein